MKGQDVYTDLSRALNSFGFDSEGFVEQFSKEHRTLQQKFISEVVFPVIACMAEKHENGWVDARNVSAAEMCADIKTALEEKHGYDIVSNGLPLV